MLQEEDVAIGEGYEWGGGCWNDDKKDVDKSKLFALHGALLRSLR